MPPRGRRRGGPGVKGTGRNLSWDVDGVVEPPPFIRHRDVCKLREEQNWARSGSAAPPPCFPANVLTLTPHSLCPGLPGAGAVIGQVPDEAVKGP